VDFGVADIRSRFALSLPPRPEFSGLLRRRLRLWLTTLDANEREAYEVVLAVSEAVSNAIEHPQRPRPPRVDVDAKIVGDLVIVRVRDHGTWRGEPSRKERGRGFPLMQALMDAVEVECSTHGTSVELRRQLALA
jgi:anti-sigma regulatory factor (Ser/Thr protein kinase)